MVIPFIVIILSILAALVVLRISRKYWKRAEVDEKREDLQTQSEVYEDVKNIKEKEVAQQKAKINRVKTL